MSAVVTGGSKNTLTTPDISTARSVRCETTLGTGREDSFVSTGGIRKGSIMQQKKTKFMSTPSVMSLMHSEPDQSKIPINKAPTYQLGPHKEKVYRHLEVKKLVETVLSTTLDDITYEHERCKDITLNLTEHILSGVKRLPMDRYKYVCTVVIGQKLGQDVQTASRCAWEEQNDSYTSVKYENKTLFAVATVYGMYAV